MSARSLIGLFLSTSEKSKPRTAAGNLVRALGSAAAMQALLQFVLHLRRVAHLG